MCCLSREANWNNSGLSCPQELTNSSVPTEEDFSQVIGWPIIVIRLI